VRLLGVHPEDRTVLGVHPEESGGTAWKKKGMEWGN
jgi:hypothetical protein